MKVYDVELVLYSSGYSRSAKINVLFNLEKKLRDVFYQR